MGFHLGGEIGVFGQVIAIGQAFGQQHMHHRTGQRAIGAGAHQLAARFDGREITLLVDDQQLAVVTAVAARPPRPLPEGARR